MMQNPITFGAAEWKLMLIFLYYIIAGVLGLTGSTLGFKNYNRNVAAAFEYFQCEKNGDNNTCSYDAQQYPALTLIMNVLLVVFPILNLVFAIRVTDVKALWMNISKLVIDKKTPAEDNSRSIAVSSLSRK